MRIVNNPHVVIFNDPRYACTKNIEMILSDENYLSFSDGESLSLNKSSDGRIFIGDGLNCVEIVNKIDLEKILESVKLATFEVIEEEGEKFICASEEITESDIISTIPLNSQIPDKDKTITVKKIEFI